MTGSFSFSLEMLLLVALLSLMMIARSESRNIVGVISAYCSDGPQQQYRRSLQARRGAGRTDAESSPKPRGWRGVRAFGGNALNSLNI
ncbi:hypothetical protein [Bradyrhizobium sp. HKCCYLS20291]|uniref:hypothetical protein n=1 Tax=Bradyrhizobium sp. HKCCYLS20291 TaxID=3420766 RepID=UPI003EBD5CB4